MTAPPPPEEIQIDDDVRRALRHGQVVDLTTTGRKTGLARRIEIDAHVLDGRIWISGLASARRRSWLANIEADPRVIYHLKSRSVRADLPATARIVDDPAERRSIIERVAAAWGRRDVEAMVARSPLIEIIVDEEADGS